MKEEKKTQRKVFKVECLEAIKQNSPKNLQIDLTLRTEDGGTVFDTLYLNAATQWKLVQFAKSIKAFHDGITAEELCHIAEGRTGNVEISTCVLNGNTFDKVDAYLRG